MGDKRCQQDTYQNCYLLHNLIFKKCYFLPPPPRERLLPELLPELPLDELLLDELLERLILRPLEELLDDPMLLEELLLLL